MKCPHCSNELNVGNVPFLWLARYGGTCVAKTECCGYGVVIRNINSHDVNPYTGSDSTDDWGNEIKLVPPKLSHAEENEHLSAVAFTHFQNNELMEGLDVIRGIKNPLQAAWVVQDVMEQMGSSMQQTKNWLLNSLFIG